MKLKIIPAFALLAAFAIWQSCKTDPPKGPDCTLTDPDLSYTLNMKLLIDTWCISCHVPGSGTNAPGDFRTFSGIKPYLDNGKILDRVVIVKDMPEGGGLSQLQRDSINCWIAAGYPQ